LSSRRNRLALCTESTRFSDPYPLDDRYGARLDQEEVIAVVALAEQDVVGFDGAQLAENWQPLALLGVETWERAITIRHLLETDAEYQRGCLSVPSELPGGRTSQAARQAVEKISRRL
jgi:hypothetical protein